MLKVVPFIRSVIIFFVLLWYFGDLSLLAADGSSEASINLDMLQTLPYISSVPAASNESGVTRYDRKKAWRGLNLFERTKSATTLLVDMEGAIVHRWHNSDIPGHGAVAMDANGALFVQVFDWKKKLDTGIAKMNWDSLIEWQRKGYFHHEIRVANNGDVYAIEKVNEFVNLGGSRLPIANDYIVIFNSSGVEKSRTSLYHLVKDRIPPKSVEALRAFYNEMIVKNGIKGMVPTHVADTPYDILHTNSIDMIEQEIDGVLKGPTVLLSIRELDLVTIVDLGQPKILWEWGPGIIQRQHHATLLKNGNVLLFDNGTEKESSRVLEVNRHTNQIVWEYPTGDRNKFYSFTRGGAQRLPNGNTLITESNSSRVFEVTKVGEIVWEFLGEVDSGKREPIYRMIRPDRSVELSLRKRIDGDLAKSQ